MKCHSSLAAIGSICIMLLILTFVGGCQRRLDKDDQEHQAQAKKGPAQLSIENGQTVIALDQATQNRLGIEVITLTSTITRSQVTAPAVVLSVQELATFRSSYLATQAQLQKSHVEADVARKEYTRLKTLFEQDQNVSEKSLQSAEGTLQTNEADERAAGQQLNLQESTVQQEWGSVASGWVVKGSPEFRHILEQSEVLVQVTMAAGSTVEVPKSISLELPVGTRIEATLVSTFPRVDPRIQGRSFLYIASGHLGLAPGMNLIAHLFVGGQMKGVIVPGSAVVWSEGKAWVYQQTASDRFARRAVAPDIRLEQGFFVPSGFSSGDKLVIQGAQALLSEELLVRQGGGLSDED
jgi:hypothetical protein